MPHQQHTAITQHRLRALNEFAESSGSNQVILWLFNKSRGAPELLLSYAVGFTPDQLSKMHNLHFTLPDGWTPSFHNQRSVSDDIELSLRIELESAGLPEQEFSLFPLTQFNTLEQKQSDFTGMVFCNAKRSLPDTSVLNLSLLLLTERIESLRLSRLRNAAIGVQSAFKEDHTSIDATLTKIGELLKTELGAKYCEFSNQNTTKLSHAARRSADRSHSTAIPTSADFAEFTIQQDSFILEKRSFRPSHELAKSFTRIKTTELQFTFIAKTRNGYLQNCFSDTDQMVANHVFGYIEPYAAARIFDENYQIIHRHLASLQTGEMKLIREVDSLCRQLSVAFTNTFLVTVDYANEEILLEVSSANMSSSLPDEYLSRLKSKYLYHWSPEQMQTLVVQSGVEITDARSMLEFHLPGDGSRSHVFVITYERETITESILRSVIIFFNELHNRLKKQEQQSDTISYLTQVRHAVIHHFTSASEGMSSLRPLWDRGRRSKVYWDSLFTNPVLGDQIGKCIWSLGQAQLLIDNGRFLLGELNRLNRKTYQINATVDNCLRTLNSQRLSRGIVVKGVTRGSPPSVMNADEPILRVALMNLVDNAFKYSQVNGTVIWALEYKPDSYRFSITSIGPPIGDQQFKQFLGIGVRGHQRDHLNQRHGTGLGLPVANRILIAHAPQAKLQLISDRFHPELGAPTNCFFFEMPFLTGQSHRAEVEAKG